MARKRSERVLVTRVTPDGSARRPDELIVEEPMTIQLDGTVVSTTMRTPGNDYELAAGFCFTEGLLGGAAITSVRYCAAPDAAAEAPGGAGVPGREAASERRGPVRVSAVSTSFNVVTVETGGRAPAPTPRLGTTSSSCGWCGSDQLDDLIGRLDPLPPTPPIDDDVLRAVPSRVLDAQGLFTATGAVHAAAAFDAGGEVLVTREDVGRHNAVDKVVGSMVLAGRVPASGLGLFVSGRASIEMVQKAWAAGFGTLLAVSAPTSLAVHGARRAGLALVGFVRDDGFNRYAEGTSPPPS